MKDFKYKIDKCLQSKSDIEKKKYYKQCKTYAEKIKKNFLNNNEYFIVLKKFYKNDDDILKKIIFVSKLFGSMISQDKNGKKYLIVRPKDKVLNKLSKQNAKENLRYHQTNFGGSIHSDGPQLSSPPKYAIMGCIKNASKGGSSILTNTKNIYKKLNKHKKNLLVELKKQYIFERRGFKFKNNNTFRKPIFEKRGNLFRFRYLRDYIEKGYKLENKSMKGNKLKALNALDEMLENKKFQKRLKLNEADILILNNHILAHGRTSFKLNKTNLRSIYRIWIS